MTRSSPTVRQQRFPTNEDGRFRIGALVAVATLLTVGIIPTVVVAAQAQNAPPISLKSGTVAAENANGFDTATSFCYQPTPTPTSVTVDPSTSSTGAALNPPCDSTVSGVNGSDTKNPLVVTTPVWAAPTADSRWVGPESSSSDLHESEPDYYVYDASFSLSCPNATLSGTARADNQVGVFLNGHLIAHQTSSSSTSNFGATGLALPDSATNISGLFRTGTNVIDFVVFDSSGNYTGLDYDITVTPGPCGASCVTGGSGGTGAVGVVGPSGIPCGTLKICKVAGFGIAVGTLFKFEITTSSGATTFVTVPAGPPPGGYCELVGPGSNFVIGSTVTIAEEIPPGDQVTSITTSSSSTINVTAGTVTIALAQPVTEVTYTDGTTGHLEICKVLENGPAPSGTKFSFTVEGHVVTIPAGVCSPSIEVLAGATVAVTEAPSPGFELMSCKTIPTGTSCTPGNNTAVIHVAPGGVGSETILTVSNAVCKPIGGHIVAGSRLITNASSKARFTSSQVRGSVTGKGIPAKTVLSSVTSPNTAIMSHAATATMATPVTIC